MTSLTKLRIIQQGIILDYYSYLRERMVETKLRNEQDTDKQDTKRSHKSERKIKEDKHNPVRT